MTIDPFAVDRPIEFDLVARRLRQLRFRRRWTQQELADRSGIGVKTMWSLESGDRTARMNLTQIVGIARALELSLFQFFDFGDMDRAIDRRSDFRSRA